MSTSIQKNQETYESVATVDDEDARTSVALTTDSIELLESKRSALGDGESISVGSLSRNERNSWYFVGHGVVDTIMTLGPVFFLVVPGMCLGLNNRPISEYGETVKAMTLLSPTIFPIVYAGILGCQSIFSTLERQITLRKLDALGISILVAWFISPLGGQASLRLLSTKPLTSTNNSTVSYYPWQEYPQKSYIQSADLAQKRWSLYGPLYMTAVQTSRQSLPEPMDLFGFVKIPDIRYLDQDNDTVTSASGVWHIVGNTTLIMYTSILGVPVVGLPDLGNYSFELVSHYWEVDCHSMDQLPLGSAWPPTPSSNSSRPTCGEDQCPTFHIRVDEGNSNDGIITFDYLSMQHQPSEDVKITSASCSASPVVVESHIQCHDRSCAVRALRRLKINAAEVWSNATLTHSPLSVFQKISEWMPGADLGSTQGNISTSELIEHWMVNNDLSTLEDPAHPYIDLMTQLPLVIFTRRLQTAINTFWDASLGSGTRMNDLQRALDMDASTWINTNTTVTRTEGDVYSCNTELAIVTIMAALVLFTAANLSLVLGLITRTPDTLGFVSSSASNNPYFTHYASSSLSGLEISRAMRDVKVRIGDVKSEETIGHIALATMDANPKKLSWTRLYD
ncbi:hypothetical protein BKA63DRAFT_593014 [Paraphoma chrysanthemicola]|nr:hypothetical protein BKA63DRAFT_593014 [Paraphoma chrysanthemicola]